MAPQLGEIFLDEWQTAMKYAFQLSQVNWLDVSDHPLSALAPLLEQAMDHALSGAASDTSKFDAQFKKADEPNQLLKRYGMLEEQKIKKHEEKWQKKRENEVRRISQANAGIAGVVQSIVNAAKQLAQSTPALLPVVPHSRSNFYHHENRKGYSKDNDCDSDDEIDFEATACLQNPGKKQQEKDEEEGENEEEEEDEADESKEEESCV